MINLVSMDDWIALCQAKAKYCRLLDTKDWQGYANLLTEDYVLDVSEGTSLPVISGRDAAIKQVRSSIETAKTAHQVHTPEIVVNGDEAETIWAMQDRVVWGPDHSLTGYGHYHGRWRRESGEWKLSALRLTRLHIDMQRPSVD